MPKRNKVVLVYLAGLLQGLALVAFPAASTIFVGSHYFDFSSTTYGSLFLPQAILSILASLCSPRIARLVGNRAVLLVSLIANLVSMTLMGISALIMKDSTSFYVLLFATSCLGIGFGLGVPVLNTLAALLFPKKIDAAILALNALLGLGTALAPLLIALFVGIGIWWGLPVSIGSGLLLLILFGLTVHFKQHSVREKEKKHMAIPHRFWLFAVAALLYGMVETANGNWASVYMHETLGANTTLASFALTLFWSFVTVGRVFFFAISRWFPETISYRLLPFVAALALVLVALVPVGDPYLGAAAFALAGLGCSAMLPLTISLGDRTLPSISASVAGGVVAFYLLGYGISAFGVGPLHEMLNIRLPALFCGFAAVAAALGVIAIFIVKIVSIQEEKR